MSVELQNTTQACFDGLTKAFFADVVPCKGTRHGNPAQALAHSVLSAAITMRYYSATQSRASSTSNTNQARISQPKSSRKRSLSEKATPTTAPSEPSSRSRDRIRTIKDSTERHTDATISLDSSVLKWLARHAAWTLATFHIGSNGMTAHQRIRGKQFKQLIFGARRADPLLTKSL